LNQAAQFAAANAELIENLFGQIENEQDSLLAEIRRIAEIPASTFHEQQRTDYLRETFSTAGLRDSHSLEKGSVLAYSESKKQSGSLVLAAHIDHVYPEGTNLATSIDGGLLRGPGVGDNAANVGAIVTLARLFTRLDIQPARGLVFCGTVREEGNGNLDGVAEVLDALGDRVWGVIAVDGRTGSIVNRSLAIHRYLLKVSGPGGHSWGHFGTPSAVHEMARIITALDDMQIPPGPKTTWNAGTIRGGTSVNAIAQECEAEIDLRSLETGHLEALEKGFLDMVNRKPKPGIQVEAELIGERPCATLPADSPLLLSALGVAEHLGIDVELAASSTDAALALWRGIPAISFGTYRGGGGHTLEEYIEIDSLVAGLKWLALTVLTATGVNA
jgi:acetylornithine deacetylase/succinyl-diaminopimelate desuccinylase-like protein